MPALHTCTDDKMLPSKTHLSHINCPQRNYLQRSHSSPNLEIISQAKKTIKKELDPERKSDSNTKSDNVFKFIHISDIVSLKMSINNALDELINKSMESGLCIELKTIPKLVLNAIERSTGDIGSLLKFGGGKSTQYDSKLLDVASSTDPEGNVGKVVEPETWEEIKQKVNQNLSLSHDYTNHQRSEFRETDGSNVSPETSLRIYNNMSVSDQDDITIKPVPPGSSIQRRRRHFPSSPHDADNAVPLADIPRLISKILSKLRENCHDCITLDIEQVPRYIQLIRDEAEGVTEATSSVGTMNVSLDLLPKLIQKAMKMRQKLSGGTVDEMVKFIQEEMEAEEEVEFVEETREVEVDEGEAFTFVPETMEAEVTMINSDRTESTLIEVDVMSEEAEVDSVSDINENIRDDFYGEEENDKYVEGDLVKEKQIDGGQIENIDDEWSKASLNDDGDSFFNGVPKLNLDLGIDTARTEDTYVVEQSDVAGVPMLGDAWLREIRRTKTQDDERASTGVAGLVNEDDSDSDVEIVTVDDDRCLESYSEGSVDDGESSRRVHKLGRAKARKRRRRRRLVNSAKQRLTPWLLASLCEDLLEDYSKLKTESTRPFAVESHRDYDCLTLNHCQVLFEKQRLWRRAEQLHALETSRRRGEKTARRLDAIKKHALEFTQRWDRVARSRHDLLYDADEFDASSRASRRLASDADLPASRNNLHDDEVTMMDVLARYNINPEPEPERSIRKEQTLAPADSKLSRVRERLSGRRRSARGQASTPSTTRPLRRAKRTKKRTKKKAKTRNCGLSLQASFLTRGSTMPVTRETIESTQSVEFMMKSASYPRPGANYRHYMQPTMASALKIRSERLPYVVDHHPHESVQKKRPVKKLKRRATAPVVAERRRVTWKRSLRRTAPERQAERRRTANQEAPRKQCAFKTSSVRYVVKRFQRPWPCPYFDPNPIYCLEEVDTPCSSQDASERALLDAVASARPSPRKKDTENFRRKATMSENNLSEYLPTKALSKFLSSRKLEVVQGRRPRVGRWDWGSSDEQKVMKVQHVSPYVKTTPPPKRRVMRGRAMRRFERMKEEIPSSRETVTERVNLI